MADSKDSGGFILRNYPDNDALEHPEKYPKTLAFSPDIIPLYGAKADKHTLVHNATWRGFTGMPIVGGDINHVYIRGHGSGGPYIASLRAFPSELILWPQVWSNVEPVSSGPVVIHGGDTPGRYASEDPLRFRPPHDAGNAYSLVANVFKLDPAKAHGDLKDFEPLASFDATTFGVDDFFTYLSKNQGLTFHNVIVADPTSKHVMAHTRLRMYGKSTVPVHFRVDWHNGAPPPAGLQVSLHDDHGKITIHRAPLEVFDKHQPIPLDPGYDGHLTLKIHSPVDEDKFFEPYSGLSLKVFKVGGALKASADSDQMMGALNVIFDPHSTRNLRFASPFARELLESRQSAGDDEPEPKGPSEKEKCTAIPDTKPATTGWYFRAGINDPNHFPRTSPFGYSPDIQPIGTDADLTAPGLWKALLDPNADYSKAHGIPLVGDANNYIFLRGHSTLTDIDVQTRVFALVGTPALHPSQWTTQGIPGNVLGEDGIVNQQTLTVANPKQFYLFNRPLNIKAPRNPGTHYCLVAEARQKRKCCPVYPKWPSEQIEDFKTGQDFVNWLAACPRSCSRNVFVWVPTKPTPGEKCFTWTCTTRLHIPRGTFCSTFWTILVEYDSPIIPPGSKWSLTCDDNEVFPDGICFKDRPINTESPACEGCHFTGATPGSDPKITLTITWCDGGRHIPPPSVKIRLAMNEVNMVSPIGHLAEKPIFEIDEWWLYVGSKYPYIGLEPNPSPLPSFSNKGRHPWEYQKCPQFCVGLVALVPEEERA